MNRIPNCVLEYFRSLQDDYDHECELERHRQERYKQNQEYIRQKQINGCAEIRFYPNECEYCQYGEDAPMTCEYDDVPSKLCSNWDNCPVYKRTSMEAFPSMSWQEIRKDIMEYHKSLKGDSK